MRLKCLILLMSRTVFSYEQPWSWNGSKEVEIYGANATTWSDHARLDVSYLAPGSVAMVVEHHKNRKVVSNVQKQISIAGWNSATCPAIDTEAGCTSGGAAVLWKHHLDCKAVALGSMCEAQG